MIQLLVTEIPIYCAYSIKRHPFPIICSSLHKCVESTRDTSAQWAQQGVTSSGADASFLGDSGAGRSPGPKVSRGLSRSGAGVGFGDVSQPSARTLCSEGGKGAIRQRQWHRCPHACLAEFRQEKREQEWRGDQLHRRGPEREAQGPGLLLGCEGQATKEKQEKTWPLRLLLGRLSV